MTDITELITAISENVTKMEELTGRYPEYAQTVENIKRVWITTLSQFVAVVIPLSFPYKDEEDLLELLKKAEEITRETKSAKPPWEMVN